MAKLEKTTFVCCSLVMILLMICAIFFSEAHDLVGTALKRRLAPLEMWRSSYNSFILNAKRASQMDDKEFERLINTSYTPIYKREYEALREYLSISEQMDLPASIHVVSLINSFGTRDSEVLRVVSGEQIPQEGYLVSPAISAVIGKIKSSNGRTAEVLPIWSDDLTAQVSVKDEDNNELYPDLALIENKQVVNFNPAFPYQEGDHIYISEYEPGGYTLARYEWTKIGRVSAVKHNEIVEKYLIEYDYTREEILEERYFIIVE